MNLVGLQNNNIASYLYGYSLLGTVYLAIFFTGSHHHLLLPPFFNLVSSFVTRVSITSTKPDLLDFRHWLGVRVSGAQPGWLMS
jgi:hypothetical protein